jgi:hypothetical protein
LAESIGFSLHDGDHPAEPRETQILVLDDRTLQPVPDAMVTVRERTANTLSSAEILTGDLRFADSSGAVAFPVSGQTSKVVTAVKNGYAGATVIGARSSQVTIFLKPLEQSVPTSVGSGVVSGWQHAPFLLGKPVYMGAVFRSLNSYDLLQFQVSNLISPLKDEIDVFGKRQIPSNIVMPDETIPIFLGSIRLNKPHYRFPVPTEKPTRLALLQAQIDSSELVAIGQSGKADASSLNKVQFDRVGLSEPFTPAADFKKDLNAEYALQPAHKVTVNDPPFPSDVVVIAVTDLQGDRNWLIPTDIKAPITEKEMQIEKPIQHGPVTLRSIAQNAPFPSRNQALITVATTKDLKRISGIITSSAGNQVNIGGFLESQAQPDSAILPEEVKIQAPSNGIGELIFRTQDKASNIQHPVWFVYSLPEAGQVGISTRELPLQNNISQYSALKLEFDPAFDEHEVDGQYVITRLRRFASETANIR